MFELLTFSAYSLITKSTVISDISSMRQIEWPKRWSSPGDSWAMFHLAGLIYIFHLSMNFKNTWLNHWNFRRSWHLFTPLLPLQLTCLDQLCCHTPPQLVKNIARRLPSCVLRRSELTSDMPATINEISEALNHILHYTYPFEAPYFVLTVTSGTSPFRAPRPLMRPPLKKSPKKVFPILSSGLCYIIAPQTSRLQWAIWLSMLIRFVLSKDNGKRHALEQLEPSQSTTVLPDVNWKRMPPVDFRTVVFRFCSIHWK